MTKQNIAPSPFFVFLLLPFLAISSSCLFPKSFAIDEVPLRSETSFEPDFAHRYSLDFGLNPNLRNLSGVSHFSLTYASQIPSGIASKEDHYWGEFTVQLTNAEFNKITTNNRTATKLEEADLYGTKSSLIALGLGVAKESHLSASLLPIEHIYELISANLTYSLYREKTSGKQFTGPGMTAKFALLKRFSEYFSMGPEFAYHLSVLKRAQDDESESSSARTLTQSFVVVGFGLNFYL